MSHAVIRFARRLANWEGNLSVEELQQREFKAHDGGPDLRPSVYELDDLKQQLVQTYAEHAHRIDPPGTALAIDVDQPATGKLEATPGDTPFAFTREQHREVVLKDKAELLDFVRAAASAPKYPVRKSQVRIYATERLEAGDPEWASLAARSTSKTWIRKLAGEE